MAKMMKAAVVHQFKKPLSIDEVPVPEAIRDASRVRRSHRKARVIAEPSVDQHKEIGGGR